MRKVALFAGNGALWGLVVGSAILVAEWLGPFVAEGLMKLVTISAHQFSVISLCVILGLVVGLLLGIIGYLSDLQDRLGEG